MKKKFNKSKEWLKEEFIIKKRNSYEIAKELGIAQSSLHRWISLFKLNRNKIIKEKYWALKIG